MVIAYAVSYAVTYIATGSVKAAQGAGLMTWELFAIIIGNWIHKTFNRSKQSADSSTDTIFVFTIKRIRQPEFWDTLIQRNNYQENV
jgi:uncharacterized membrane protein